MRRPALLACLAAALLAAPAAAAPADPARSLVWVTCPTLAPGSSGHAPVYGELAPSGAVTLHAPVSAVRTGNAFHDSIIRQVMRGEVVLELGPLRLSPGVRRHRVTGLLRVAGGASPVPLVVRTIRKAEGIYMQTYCRVPLAPYGVRTLQGGNPGDVRVAIDAFFPGI